MHNKSLVLLAIYPFVMTRSKWAQNNCTMKGPDVDSTGIRIEFGNFVALYITDSSFLKSIHNWNGKFKLFGIERQELIVIITAPRLSYFYKNRHLTNTSFTVLGNLNLESVALKKMG